MVSSTASRAEPYEAPRTGRGYYGQLEMCYIGRDQTLVPEMEKVLWRLTVKKSVLFIMLLACYWHLIKAD